MDKHSTIEYTQTVCGCGNELSTLFYFLTAENSFLEFAEIYGVKKENLGLMGFCKKDLNYLIPGDVPGCPAEGLILCCMKTLRFGITSPISAFKHDEIVFQIKGDVRFGRKYPESLPGALSSTETLSWF